MDSPHHTNTIVIGAGAAGLACAVCLKQSGIPFILLEQSNGIGNEWKKRYDRLHLHTTKKHSRLPYLKMPEHYPKYVSKDDFAKYLEQYAAAFNIQPDYKKKVISVKKEENIWEVRTETEIFCCNHIIMATGLARKPLRVDWEGTKNFNGEILHSSEYLNGKSYKNKNVLVLGFGNSACEIALCLYEHGALPWLSVRNGVNILPREIAGLSIVNIALLENWLIRISPTLADAINRPLLRLINGNIRKYGLTTSENGPMTQIVKQKKVPLLDIGTMALIKRGSIRVVPGIKEIAHNTVRFSDGREEKFEVIISATGYVPAFEEFLIDFEKVCDDDGFPLVSGKESALPGLFFCGFHVSPTGMLREIAIEARKIARIIKNKKILKSKTV